MIRFRCPKCDKTLGVDESRAGEVGVCPECKSKFRIPALKNGEEFEDASRKTSRPTREDDEPSPPVRKRRRMEDDTEPSSDYESEEPRTLSSLSFVLMFCWLLWISGSILIVASWGNVVPPAIGWIGFGIATAGTLLSYIDLE